MKALFKFNGMNFTVPYSVTNVLGTDVYSVDLSGNLYLNEFLQSPHEFQIEKGLSTRANYYVEKKPGGSELSFKIRMAIVTKLK
jgi:hypothetical protein